MSSLCGSDQSTEGSIYYILRKEIGVSFLIDMAGDIFVVNIGGYIGDSTQPELVYTKMPDKQVHYQKDIKE